MITSLELTNWRTHQNSHLDFSKGTNIIVGVMGSGKSSIVNAISYSLFGTFPALKSKQVSLKEIIMNKPNLTDKATTKIVFEQNDKTYSVIRELKIEGTNEAKIFENDKLIAGPKQKDVNERVEQILGLNYELFSRAVYAEQNEMDFFLKLTPSERKKKFDELLELEKYELVRKNSLSLKNQIMKENKQKSEFLIQQKLALKEAMSDNLEEKIKNLNLEIETDKKNIEKINLEIEKKQKEYNEIEKKQKEYQEAKLIFEKTKSQIDTLTYNLKNKEIIDIEKLKKEKEYLIKKISSKKLELVDTEKQTNEFEKTKNNIIEKESVLDYRTREINKETDSIVKLSGDCPTCKQKMDEKHKKELIEKLNKELSQIKKEIIENNKNKEEIISLNDSLKEKKKLLQTEIDALTKKEYEINQKERDSINNKKIENEIKSLLQTLPEKEKKVDENKFDENDLVKKRIEFYEIKNLYSITKEKLNSKNDLKKSYENSFNKIQLLNKNIENSENEIKKSELAAQKLGIFENCLISTQVELREALLQTINVAMSNIWQQIYPYKDYLDARLSIVENGYDLEVETRNGSWVRVEGILSGGERSAAALCIRIAFSLVLTKQLSMLILDEPTHNLDKNAVEKLATMLREDLPNLVDQIFVITHDKELEAGASSKLYLINRNKDIDGITKIEEILQE